MQHWPQHLKADPIPTLLAAGDQALAYFVRRDLLDEQVASISSLWELPDIQKILKKQQPDGSWKYLGKQTVVYPEHHYSLVETWKQFRILVEQYGLTKEHPVGRKAAEYLFSCQTEEGDIRGMIGNQYATYYTGAMMSLLIQAGYAYDPRIEKGFQWLLSMRQDDGGWTIPILTTDVSWDEQIRLTSHYAEPLEPDRSQPFSHNWTGMVLRAFAVHPTYRTSEAARKAASLLASRFFQPDVYNSYKAASYWVKFQYPFWWNNLIAALDSISLIGLSKDENAIQQALQWFTEHQEKNGLWKLSYAKNSKNKENKKILAEKCWVTLAICRIFRRYYL